jgi:transcription antitermination protein NusB
MKSSRRKSRIAALQALYEIDAAGHSVESVIKEHVENKSLSDENAEFAGDLINGVVNNREQIDSCIRRFAPTWPIDQISIVDRNILRLAIFEILLDNKTPVKVAIDEAVELSKTFGSDHSSKFINGVLGSVSSISTRNETEV